MPEVAYAAASSLLADLQENPKLDDLETNALLLSHLISAPVANEQFERHLTNIRTTLLFHSSDRHLSLTVAVARQCYINEYAWPVSRAEALAIDRLRARLDKEERPNSSDLAALAMFQPLSSIVSAKRWGRQGWPDVVEDLLRQQLVEPTQEADIAGRIEQWTPIADPTSGAVRMQYEQNPYPRWVVCDQIEPTSLKAFVRRLSSADGVADRLSDEPSILIAGCGTGQHSIATARRFPAANVTAIDLSRSSLAYAVRKTREVGISIRYGQADILALGGWQDRFDVIEASGVLHHLREPIAGWRILVDLLKPGGLMRLGLYSRLGRRHVAAARSIVQDSGLASDEDGIRAARTLLQQLPGDDVARGVVSSFDFYSLSSCRDLLFHVQEQTFELPGIASTLDELRLGFLGFDLPDAVMSRFRARFRHDDRDLGAWHACEVDNPTTFTGMYQFWAVKN